MKLTVVGSTGSTDGPDSPASCYLLEGPDPKNPLAEQMSSFKIVLELGFGAFGALQKYLHPADIKAVLLSHLHSDHMVDMSALAVYSRWYPFGKTPIIDVWGPAQTLERVQDVDWSPRADTYVNEFKFHTFSLGKAADIGPFRIEVFEAFHTVEAFCLRITQTMGGRAGSVLCFSGDTDECPGLMKAAKDCDLFLCEAGFIEKETVRGVHLTGKRAGKVAAKAQVKKLLLTHIQPWADKQETMIAAQKEYNGECVLATPGLQIEV